MTHIRRCSVFLVLPLAFLVVLSACTSARTESRPAPGAAGTVTAPVDSVVLPPQLEAQLDTIERHVLAARGLSQKESIEKRVISREEAGRYIGDELERERADIDLRSNVYRVLGFIPADGDLLRIQQELLTGQVKGFYDPRTKRLYVVSESNDLSASDEVTLAHEIVHALQDQHYDLQRIRQGTRADWDRADALTALIEGDATALMIAYATRHRKGSLSDAASLAQLRDLARFPVALQRELQFPYFAGMAFVDSLSGGSNWPAVNAAYGRLPTTTEQILHPEKYRAGESAKAVRIPDLSSKLGSSWERLGGSTFGEFSLRNYLGLQLDRDAVATAANGWGGDGWVLYGEQQGAFALYMVFAWDSDVDRNEFHVAYQDWLRRQGGDVQTLGGGSLRWQAAGKAIALDQRGEVSRLIIATSAAALERALTAEQ